MHFVIRLKKICLRTFKRNVGANVESIFVHPVSVNIFENLIKLTEWKRHSLTSTNLFRECFQFAGLNNSPPPIFSSSEMLNVRTFTPGGGMQKEKTIWVRSKVIRSASVPNSWVSEHYFAFSHFHLLLLFHFHYVTWKLERAKLTYYGYGSGQITTGGP